MVYVPAPPTSSGPSNAEVYERKLRRLTDALERDEVSKTEATEKLIDLLDNWEIVSVRKRIREETEPYDIKNTYGYELFRLIFMTMVGRVVVITGIAMALYFLIEKGIWTF